MTRWPRRIRPWALAVRVAAVPFWYPFALLAWLGEKSDAIFWRIESLLPEASRPSSHHPTARREVNHGNRRRY